MMKYVMMLATILVLNLNEIDTSDDDLTPEKVHEKRAPDVINFSYLAGCGKDMKKNEEFKACFLNESPSLGDVNKQINQCEEKVNKGNAATFGGLNKLCNTNDKDSYKDAKRIARTRCIHEMRAQDTEGDGEAMKLENAYKKTATAIDKCTQDPN